FTVTGGFTISGGGAGTIGATARVVIPTLGVNQSIFNGQVSRQSASINRTSSSLAASVAGTHPGNIVVTAPGADPQETNCNFTVNIIKPPSITCGGFTTSPENPEPGDSFD